MRLASVSFAGHETTGTEDATCMILLCIPPETLAQHHRHRVPARPTSTRQEDNDVSSGAYAARCQIIPQLTAHSQPLL